MYAGTLVKAFPVSLLSRISPSLLLLILLTILVFPSACAVTQKNASGLSLADPTYALQSSLAQDPRLAGCSFMVESHDGWIVLKGKVLCLGQKVLAEEYAYQTGRATRVVNELKIHPSQASDSSIRTSILEAIPPDCRRSILDLDIQVKDLHVTLTGRCRKTCLKDLLLNIAAFTPGVRSVDDQISLVCYPEDMNLTDARLCSAVRAVLDSFPIPRGWVTAEVRNGIVTLKGHLDSYKDIEGIDRAVRNLPGVCAVKDLITISPWFSVENPTIEHHVFQ